jgi:hypothetical protein
MGQEREFQGSCVDTARPEPVACSKMGSASGSRRRKGLKAASKSPARSKSVPSSAAAPGADKAKGGVAGKQSPKARGDVPAKGSTRSAERAAKDGGTKAGAETLVAAVDRSPPALPIPIASFTF